MKFIKYIIIYLISTYCLTAYAAEYLVTSGDEIEDVMENAQPGDVLIMQNGLWMDEKIEFEGYGAEGDSIYLRAETPGQVILSGKSNFRMAGEYLVADGLYFFNGSSPSGGVMEFRSGGFGSACHCRITHCAVVNYNPDVSKDYKWISIYGTNNRLDHCYLAGKEHSGTTVVVWFSNTDTEAHYHQIDHNYFGPRPPLGYNGGETIRIGTSDYSMRNSRTTVEWNYFEQCNGEAEIISNKSCENVYQYNTFVECEGALTLRHGNRNTVRNNFFFGNQKPGTGGVRVIGEDQTVINNYFEGLYGEDYTAALPIMNGVPNSPLNRYFQVKNAFIAFNTFVDCKQTLVLGFGANSELSLVPKDCVIANNLMKSDFQLAFLKSSPENLTLEGNLAEGSLGFCNPEGITLTDLQLVYEDPFWRPDAGSPAIDGAAGVYEIDEDMEGQSRDDSPDVGADEHADDPVLIRPLTTEDAGPGWIENLEVPFMLAVSHEGTGEIILDPPGGLYDAGTVVTLTAVPGPESTFIEWTGDLTGNALVDSIIVTGNHSITAHFQDPNYYKIAPWIVGRGEVEYSPDEDEYREGTVVVVTAVPETGWIFSSWSGSLTGSTNPDTLTMTKNHSLVVTFTQETGIESTGLPQSYALHQNYPNPFNPATTIQFSLKEAGITSLVVFDSQGKEVRSLIEAFLPAGRHQVQLDASALASGVYYYRLTSGTYSEMKKMILMK